MDLLKKALNTTAVCALTAAVAFGTVEAQAETAGTNIQAIVANAFTFTETTALGFGSMVAINDATDTSTLVVDHTAAPIYNNPGAAILIEVLPATAGTFDISGAAPSTAITITFPASVTLNCGACAVGTEDFTVDTFVSSGAGTETTDGTGAVTFTIGATLNTINSANAYNDGTYSGAYTVTANY